MASRSEVAEDWVTPPWAISSWAEAAAMKQAERMRRNTGWAPIRDPSFCGSAYENANDRRRVGRAAVLGCWRAGAPDPRAEIRRECGALAGRTARRGTAGNAADTAGSIALGSRSGQPNPLACGLARNEKRRKAREGCERAAVSAIEWRHAPRSNSRA